MQAHLGVRLSIARLSLASLSWGQVSLSASCVKPPRSKPPRCAGTPKPRALTIPAIPSHIWPSISTSRLVVVGLGERRLHLGGLALHPRCLALVHHLLGLLRDLRERRGAFRLPLTPSCTPRPAQTPMRGQESVLSAWRRAAEARVEELQLVPDLLCESDLLCDLLHESRPHVYDLFRVALPSP